MRRRIQSSRRGNAAIEFGFWLPVIMVMLSGIIDFGWYMSQAEAVIRASRDGARRGAATFESTGDPLGTNVEPAAIVGANEVLNSLGVTGCTVVPDTGTNAAGFDFVNVNVSCPWIPLIGIFPALGTDLNYHFTMFLEKQ